MDQLIAAAQAGSEEALVELLERCRAQLRRYANRECASDDVEEAVQDALWLLYPRWSAPGNRSILGLVVPNRSSRMSAASPQTTRRGPMERTRSVRAPTTGARMKIGRAAGGGRFRAHV